MDHPSWPSGFKSTDHASAGLTYCAIGALAFIGHTPGEEDLKRLGYADSASLSLSDCIRWIIGRQTTSLEDVESEKEEPQPQSGPVPISSSPLGSPHSAQFPHAPPATPKASPQTPVELDLSRDHLRCAGFNGRPNKLADTCYCFWNAGALAVSIFHIPKLLLFSC